MRGIAGAIAAALAACVVTAVPAVASVGVGTPGKIAVVEAAGPGVSQLWIRDELGSGSAQATNIGDVSELSTQTHAYVGTVSSPSWSPDGQRVAFTKPVFDTTIDGGDISHTAVFTVKWDGTGLQQVSYPPTTRPGTPDGQGGRKNDARTESDSEPRWSPDGSTIAFIRTVGVGSEATDYGDRGTWAETVSASGGTGTALEHLPPDSQSLVDLAWGGEDNGGFGLVGAVGISGQVPRLQTIPGNTVLVSDASAVRDFDVSPDGQALTYATFGANGAKLVTHRLSGGPDDAYAEPQGEEPVARFAGDGSGVLHPGCAPAGHTQICGLLEHLLPDPSGDMRDADPEDRIVVPSSAAIPGVGSAFRSGFDVQAQDLPIVLVPGFLGTELDCDGSAAWPTLPTANLDALRLNADGETNAACGNVAPSQVIDSVAGTDVYGHAMTWLEAHDPGLHVEVPWDWRRTPQANFVRMNGAVDQALALPKAAAQGVRRVTLFGHSYGGILIRAWLSGVQNASRRVARVLTAGTPYWGSVKPFLPLAFGREDPTYGFKDYTISRTLFNHDALQAFARTAPGLYTNFTSPHHPGWLSWDGAAVPTSGLPDLVGGAQLGGVSQLATNAIALHSQIDGFFDGNGTIDVRAVVGVGTPTPSALVVSHDADGRLRATVTMADGDGTIEAIPATQGPVGTATPLKASSGGQYYAHVQDRCRIQHVPLPADPGVLDAYGDFLITGHVPRKLDASQCSAGGAVVDVSDEVLGTGVQPAPQTRSARSRATRAAAMTPADALAAGVIDGLPLVGDSLLFLRNETPVDLTIDAHDLRFTIAPVVDGVQQPPVSYGPVTGTLVLHEGAAEPGPAVTLDGVPLAPSDSAAPAGATTATPSPTGAATPAQPAAAAGAPIGHRAATLRARRRGSRVAVTVACPAGGPACRGVLMLSPRHGRRYARVSVRVAAGRSRTYLVRLTAAGRRALARKPSAIRLTLRIAGVPPVTGSVRRQ